MPALGYESRYAIDANTSLFGTIEGLLKTVCKRPTLAVVMGIRQDDGVFAEVFTMNFGDSSTWEHPFEDIAFAKAELTAKHNMPSREVQLMHPELLEVGTDDEMGDIKYWGSAIVGNLVVACSGVESYFDEAFSYMIAYLWLGLIQHEQERMHGLRSGDGHFF